MAFFNSLKLEISSVVNDTDLNNAVIKLLLVELSGLIQKNNIGADNCSNGCRRKGV